MGSSLRRDPSSFCGKEISRGGHAATEELDFAYAPSVGGGKFQLFSIFCLLVRLAWYSSTSKRTKELKAAVRIDTTNFPTYYSTMKTMNVSEAKTHFSSVVDWVKQGETVLICKRNLPVAKITGLSVDGSDEKHHTVIGWAKGSGARILSELTDPILAEGDWEMMK